MEVSKTAFKSDMNLFGCPGQMVVSECEVSGQGGTAKDRLPRDTAGQKPLNVRHMVAGFGADRQMHDTHLTRGVVAL
ncbi:hypothetical protein CEW89_13865 [Celeribacter ethanolicus]|uniref:Uncharacterized protein n=1 Tax=Celeribacter ethanolicus TaxID=1758178 RepID=A0A291GER6_9RHOB|nr:hypothetical protein CEW89_13865 [Celeribacter ethanolicus]